MITNENAQLVFIVHVLCIMTVAEKQQNILNLREFGVSKMFVKIGIFGKLTGGFENFL